MLRIYLDTCVWCRPFDGQTQKKVVKETEAFFKILRMVDRKEASLVESQILDEEVQEIENARKRELVKSLMFYSIAEKLDYVPDEYKELMKLSLKIPDASHIACAIALNAEYFISVDKRLLSRGKKIERLYRIKICNPEEFLRLEGE